MEVMMRFEQDFGIEVNPDTIAQLTSISAITNYLQDGGKD
jgi:acyl carrier protein